MGMAKWESFLENHIEGFFNRRFSSDLEPVELSKALQRELVQKRRKASDGHVVPNEYMLEVGAADYERLCAQRIIDELHADVERTVILEDCFMDGTLSIRMEKSKEKKGVLRVRSRFFSQAETPSDAVEPHTIVLDRADFARPLNLPRAHELASLTAVRGVDKDSYLAIDEKQIYIGRLEKNDFILTDANASRLHAYVTYERHRHVLHDAESTNGTFVNGQPVTSVCLQAGDEIQIGSTILLYEVL